MGRVVRLREALPRRDPDSICLAAAEAYQVAEEDLRVRGRKGNRARNVVIYLARQHSALPFPAGKHRTVAVKVIDFRGNEVMRVCS